MPALLTHPEDELRLTGRSLAARQAVNVLAEIHKSSISGRNTLHQPEICCSARQRVMKIAGATGEQRHRDRRQMWCRTGKVWSR